MRPLQYLLGKCKTLWGKQYTVALNCRITRDLPVECQITAPGSWHMAKQGLSVLTHREKIIATAENNLSCMLSEAHGTVEDDLAC